VVAGLTACVGLFVPYADARYILHEITTRGLAFVILSAIFGLGSLWLLETIDARHPSGSGVCGGRARAGLALAQWDYVSRRRSPSRRQQHRRERSLPS
jgi:hypothetical protein